MEPIKIILLNVRKWALTTEDGQDLDGVTLYYVNPSSRPDTKDFRGCEVFKSSSPKSILNDLKDAPIPGIHHAYFDMRRNPKTQKPELSIVRCQAIAPLEVK